MSLKNYEKLVRDFISKEFEGYCEEPVLSGLAEALPKAWQRLCAGERTAAAGLLQTAEKTYVSLARAMLRHGKKKAALEHLSKTLQLLDMIRHADRFQAVAGLTSLPAGPAGLYRWQTLHRLVHVGDGGVEIISRNRGADEGIGIRGGKLVLSTGGKAREITFFLEAATAEDRIYIGQMGKNPLDLYCLEFGPAAQVLASVAARLDGIGTPPPLQPLTKPALEETADVPGFRDEATGRSVPATDLKFPEILACVSHRLFKAEGRLTVASLLRRLPKSEVYGADPAALQRWLDTALTFDTCLALDGYRVLYHFTSPQGDVFAHNQGIICTPDLLVVPPDLAGFTWADAFVPHFLEQGEDKIAVTHPVAYHLLREAFRAGPPLLDDGGRQPVLLGNWRVGDFLMGVSQAAQAAAAGYPLTLTNADDQLFGLPPDVLERPGLRPLFAAAESGVRLAYYGGYVDGLRNLIRGKLGFNLSNRFPSQQRATTFSHHWLKATNKYWRPAGGPTPSDVSRQMKARPRARQEIGIFFSFELEKRIWSEQSVFFEKLVAWLKTLPLPVHIYVNGLTSYRLRSKTPDGVIRLLNAEEDFLESFRKDCLADCGNVSLTSMIGWTIIEKAELIGDKVDFFVGPLGSGTMLASFGYEKRGVVYSSNALQDDLRDSYRNLDYMVGPRTEFVHRDDVHDKEKSGKVKGFDGASTSNYSIDPDHVLQLVKHTLGVDFYDLDRPSAEPPRDERLLSLPRRRGFLRSVVAGWRRA